MIFPFGTWGLVPAVAVREQLRLAFARWGLPARQGMRAGFSQQGVFRATGHARLS
jgi:hypothetical protein